jgi:5'(3')-deoxyribonucleotidase
MHILLKDLLKEEEDKEGDESPLKIQFYCDMDGVLVDMDGGFKKLSGGLTPKEYEAEHGKSSFWKLVNKDPNFWINLEPMPDAKTLWDFIKDNFKDPVPVILSAGQGARVVEQKTAWIRKHIDPSVKVIIAASGVKKPEYILKTDGMVTHLLLDDTPKNIDAWDNEANHRIALLHKDAASSIKNISDILLKNTSKFLM